MAVTAFRTRGFAGSRHPGLVPFGALLLETTHTSEASAAIEIEAWQARMRRGEISRIELIDCRVGGTLTNLKIDGQTRIPWSWIG
jgi:hypothetical protein